jgi:hypothetical protein
VLKTEVVTDIEDASMEDIVVLISVAIAASSPLLPLAKYKS